MSAADDDDEETRVADKHPLQGMRAGLPLPPPRGAPMKAAPAAALPPPRAPAAPAPAAYPKVQPEMAPLVRTQAMQRAPAAEAATTPDLKTPIMPQRPELPPTPPVVRAKMPSVHPELGAVEPVAYAPAPAPAKAPSIPAAPPIPVQRPLPPQPVAAPLASQAPFETPPAETPVLITGEHEPSGISDFVIRYFIVCGALTVVGLVVLIYLQL